MDMTKCYTFYSYKGGSGRSTTAMNALYHLIDELGASHENPVLLVDVDLESAGLTFFFNQENRFLGGGALGSAAFDTTYVLASEVNPLNYFQESTLLKTVPEAFITELSKEFSNVESIFDGIKLSHPRWDLLNQIAKAYNESRDPDSDGNTELLEFFDFSKFLANLSKIEKMSVLSAEEKVKKKQEIILDFLPASVYTDISKYFNREAGTVRFLGVDTRQNKERLARNHAVEAIEALIEACTRKKFKAIIFDSGAGTQSSAHLLQYKSDVIIYCMRPTVQFAKGTKTAIRAYKEKLKENDARVILLPMAVSQNDEGGALSRDCFREIEKIVQEAPEIIDDTFCSFETALCEVGLFKWREQILGVNYDPSVDDAEISPLPEEVKLVVDKYGNEETLPPDASQAYATYRSLARRIVELSKEKT